MSELLLPPSSNWFQHNAVTCREADRLLVTASFKSIVVYKIPEEKAPPKCLKLIAYNLGKLTGLSLFPDESHAEFGQALAAIGDQRSLSLINIHNGSFLANQSVQKVNLNSLSWGRVRDEDIVVAVGDKGYIVVWQPRYLVIRSFNLDVKKNLTVVDVLPHCKDQALIASDKTILLVSLQSGDILNQYKGHDSPIYTISWYTGDVNPRTVDALPTNSRWKLDEKDTRDVSPTERDSSEGPFFATSDLGRNVLVWDLSANRFLTKTNAPVSAAGARKGGRDRAQSKGQHISLCWVRDRLFSSTVMGEIIEWNLSSTDPRYKLVNHSHSRAIYNMVTLGNLVITFSQDRNMHCFDSASSAPFFNIPTLGACACSVAFSPHDASRLAIGMQDESIKLLTLGGECQKTQVFYQNIKGKVLSLCWHPGQEGKLLFGTSEGQVGVADVFSNKTSTFAFYHQKSVYKVEWGLPMAPAKTGLKERWYAYSFGDRDLIARSALSYLDDPVPLNDLLGISKDSANDFCLSEFSFNPDYQFLALGSVNGEVKIIERETCDCLIVICRARKVIQHLLWKPPCQSDHSSLVLGVASSENSVFVFDLSQQLNERTKDTACQTLTQPWRDLSAHFGRVVWLSWSSHKDGLLATASYDHTVQIWDTNSGEPVGNFGGHNHRVFRAEFFPTDSDRVLSFAEENSIHSWQISKLTARTPSESSAAAKENKKKSRMVVPDEEEQSGTGGGGGGTADTTCGIEVNAKKMPGEASAVTAVLPSKRSSQKKSSFPLFHGVSSRKKSFHHMCILSLLDAKQEEEARAKERERCEGLCEEDLDEAAAGSSSDGVSNESPAAEVTPLEDRVSKSLAKYRQFHPSEEVLPEVEDLCFYLNFFGAVPQLDKVVKEEIKYHDNNENSTRANLMRSWQGSLESYIKWAAKHKQLEPFLVSAAPQVSFSLWEYACEAYAEQLAVEDPVTAASYLVLVHKDEGAVDLLLQCKLFREALTIAKYKMGFNPSLIQKVLSAWFSSAIFEGNFETAAVLQLCLGNTLNAARTLARRTEPRSLIVAAQLYLAAENHDLATSTAVLAFKEASSRNEYEKFEAILQHLPTLHWCKYIHICHETILEHLESMKTPTQTSVQEEPVLKAVLRKWDEEGINESSFIAFSKEIKQNLAALKLPTSLKHLWFLVSVSLSEMLLDGFSCTEAKWEKSLEVAINHILFWGKADQNYNLSHLLLSRGHTDVSTLQVAINIEERPAAVKQLQEMYISSEGNFVLSLLENDDKYLPWREDIDGCEKETSDRSQENENLKTQNGEVVSSSLTNNCETVDARNEPESALSTGQREKNVESSCPGEKVTNEAAQLSNEKETSIKEKHCDTLHIYKYKKDFFNVFDVFIEESVRNFKEGRSSYEECLKAHSQIISKLHERSAIDMRLYTNMIAKIGSKENTTET